MRSHLTVALLAALMCFAATNSWAACQRLGFAVNDYGKKGPIRDAKKLLDGYIAKWTAERGIKRYRVGKKNGNLRVVLGFRIFRRAHVQSICNFLLEGWI